MTRQRRERREAVTNPASVKEPSLQSQELVPNEARLGRPNSKVSTEASFFRICKEVHSQMLLKQSWWEEAGRDRQCTSGKRRALPEALSAQVTGVPAKAQGLTSLVTQVEHIPRLPERCRGVSTVGVFLHTRPPLLRISMLNGAPRSPLS